LHSIAPAPREVPQLARLAFAFSAFVHCGHPVGRRTIVTTRGRIRRSSGRTIVLTAVYPSGLEKGGEITTSSSRDSTRSLSFPLRLSNCRSAKAAPQT